MCHNICYVLNGCWNVSPIRACFVIHPSHTEIRSKKICKFSQNIKTLQQPCSHPEIKTVCQCNRKVFKIAILNICRTLEIEYLSNCKSTVYCIFIQETWDLIPKVVIMAEIIHTFHGCCQYLKSTLLLYLVDEVQDIKQNEINYRVSAMCDTNPMR